MRIDGYLLTVKCTIRADECLPLGSSTLKDSPANGTSATSTELSRVGGRAAGGRDWRRLERFAEVREDLPDRPRIGNERDESDVATTPRARKRKLLAHPSHEFGLWRREVSWEGGLSHEPQQSPGASPPAAIRSCARDGTIPSGTVPVGRRSRP